MKSVGIKVLKDNLSKYLKLVQAGETILVTDRDEVIARIPSSHPPRAGKGGRVQAFLAVRARRGSMTLASARTAASLRDLLDAPRPRVKINLQEPSGELRGD